MAFVPLTAAKITLQGAVSGQRMDLDFTKATAVGMVTFTRDLQTFAQINEDFFIADGYTADAVNAADYLEVYVGGITTGRRISGGILKTAPTGPNRMMVGPIKKGQLALYWYSA